MNSKKQNSATNSASKLSFSASSSKQNDISKSDKKRKNEDDEIANHKSKGFVDDWPECDRDLECTRLIRGIKKIMQTSWAEYFNAPVDLIQYSDYGEIIENPIDLNSIKARLEARSYKSLNAIKLDVDFIKKNAIQYNYSNRLIIKNAKITTYLVQEFIRREKLTDPIAIIQEVKQNKDQFYSGAENESEEENQFSAKWIRKCKRLLNDLFKNQDSTPFRSAVDLSKYKDYLSVVKEPMDLAVIKEQLLTGYYDNPFEVNKDLNSIIQNSKLYNTDKQSMIYTMTSNLQSYINEQMKPILDNYKQKQLNANRNQKSAKNSNKKLKKDPNLNDTLKQSPTKLLTQTDRIQKLIAKETNENEVGSSSKVIEEIQLDIQTEFKSKLRRDYDLIIMQIEQNNEDRIRVLEQQINSLKDGYDLKIKQLTKKYDAKLKEHDQQLDEIIDDKLNRFKIELNNSNLAAKLTILPNSSCFNLTFEEEYKRLNEENEF